MLNSPARPRGSVIGLLTVLFAVTLQSQAPPLPLPSTPLIFAGSGPGGGLLRVLQADGTPLVTVAPFGSGFTGGVRVAAGDVNGDGITDVVVAMASGGGQVRVFSGADGAPLGESSPFGAGFTGGVFVATGDVNADGHDDILLGAGTGSGLAQVDRRGHARRGRPGRALRRQLHRRGHRRDGRCQRRRPRRPDRRDRVRRADPHLRRPDAGPAGVGVPVRAAVPGRRQRRRRRRQRRRDRRGGLRPAQLRRAGPRLHDAGRAADRGSPVQRRAGREPGDARPQRRWPRRPGHGGRRRGRAESAHVQHPRPDADARRRRLRSRVHRRRLRRHAELGQDAVHQRQHRRRSPRGRPARSASPPATAPARC